MVSCTDLCCCFFHDVFKLTLSKIHFMQSIKVSNSLDLDEAFCWASSWSERPRTPSAKRDYSWKFQTGFHYFEQMHNPFLAVWFHQPSISQRSTTSRNKPRCQTSKWQSIKEQNHIDHQGINLKSFYLLMPGDKDSKPGLSKRQHTL